MKKGKIKTGRANRKCKFLPSEILSIFTLVFRLVSASQLKYQAAHFYNEGF